MAASGGAPGVGGRVLVREPDICQSQLTIRGHAITAETVLARWLAGESIRSLSRDYGLKPAVVEAALREWFGGAPGVGAT